MASERIDPRDFPAEPISLDHYARYVLAGEFAPGKRVLDVACGLGYGTRYLRAAGAASVLGVDVAEEAIRMAREQYATDGVSFAIADAHHLSDTVAAAWDVITSFETIEHLVDPGKFIAECGALLAPGGVLVASVPNHAQDPEGENEFHVQRFNRNSFEQLLHSTFASVTIVPQYFALASFIDLGDHVQVEDLCITSAAQSASAAPGASEPECFVAVAANEPPLFVGRSVLVHARKFWEHHQSLMQGKGWLEEQVANWQAKATELSVSLERQTVVINELEDGKRWLEEQRANWESHAAELAAILERQNAEVKDLEEGKRWLEEQRANWERRSSELSAELEHRPPNPSRSSEP
jgi:SAM-dependent methyltransferase